MMTVDLSQYPVWVVPELGMYSSLDRRALAADPGRCLARGCRGSAGDDEAAPTVPRWAIEGVGLCTLHAGSLKLLLVSLAKTWRDLEHGLTARRPGPASGGTGGGRSSAVTDIATLWNPAVAHVIHELRDWTHYLVRTVQRERPVPERTHGLALLTELQTLTTTWNLHGPSGMSAEDVRRLSTLARNRAEIEARANLRWPMDESGNVAVVLAALALHHSTWLSHYPTLAPAWLADARAHVRAAEAALHTQPLRRRQIAGHVCQQEVGQFLDGTPAICAAPLAVVFTEPGDDRPSTILCTENPAHPQLQRADWLDLAALDTPHG